MAFVYNGTGWSPTDFTCKHCWAHVGVYTKDLRFQPSEGADPAYFYVACPHCDTRHKYPSDKIPPMVKDKLREDFKKGPSEPIDPPKRKWYHYIAAIFNAETNDGCTM